MFLSVVIPCYNEEERIGKTLQTIASYFKDKPYEWEVIVVDNGSTDKTRNVAENFHSQIPHLTIFSKKSHGKGWAVKQGMLLAKGDFRLFTDADNSTDISHVETFLEWAEKGYDVVISSRKIEGAKITHPQPVSRVALGNLFTFVVNLIIPLGIKDTQNGFKLFTAKAAEKIFPHQTIFYWAFDVEILALAKQFEFKIKEVPITWVNNDSSKMDFKGMSRMIFEVIITRLHMMTRTYLK